MQKCTMCFTKHKIIIGGLCPYCKTTVQQQKKAEAKEHMVAASPVPEQPKPYCKCSICMGLKDPTNLIKACKSCKQPTNSMSGYCQYCWSLGLLGKGAIAFAELPSPLLQNGDSLSIGSSEYQKGKWVSSPFEVGEKIAPGYLGPTQLEKALAAKKIKEEQTQNYDGLKYVPGPLPYTNAATLKAFNEYIEKSWNGAFNKAYEEKTKEFQKENLNFWNNKKESALSAPYSNQEPELQLPPPAPNHASQVEAMKNLVESFEKSWMLPLGTLTNVAIIPLTVQLSDPPAIEQESVELTLSGLTPEEADQLQKQYGKSKTVMVAKTVRKEIGTNSKAIISWPFESSSMISNGVIPVYKTQLNEDGTMSCNCRGWTTGSAKNPDGRFCKHTKAIESEYDTKSLYKKWKKGEPLGVDFEPVEESASQKTPGTSKSVGLAMVCKRLIEL